MIYDLIIIGMGIAGTSAAIYAKNGGLNVLVLEKDTPGGLLNKINSIHNYPGYTVVTGPDLAFQLFDSMNKLKIPYKKAVVKNIKNLEQTKRVETDLGNFESKYVIIATGRTNRKLGLENEEKLLGKGISTCALCDGNLYQGKDIAVVGGGNSAMEEALYLSNIGNKIYLIHRRDSFRAEESLIKKVKEKENIEIFYNSQITEIKDKNDRLSSLVINNKEEIFVSALFIYIGFEPNLNFTKELDILDNEGYILVDHNYETRIKGIFAVGDCIKKEIYQLITASSEGATAAIHIVKKVNKSEAR